MTNFLKKEIEFNKKDKLFLLLGFLFETISILVVFYLKRELDILSIICSYCGILSLVLSASGKISNSLFGIIQILCYMFAVSIPNRLYGEIFKGCYGLILTFIGIFIWLKKYDNGRIKTKNMNKKMYLIALLMALIIFIISFFAFIYFNDGRPLLDSLMLSISLTANILNILKYSQSWLIYIIINIIGSILQVSVGNYITMPLYIFGTLNAIYGYVNWKQNFK